MQKIAQNVGSSIDSLNAKILLMQNELSSLKVQNKGISDSLKTLNETLRNADIATTFYDTHLATYTTIFTVLISLLIAGITLYNFFGIYKPIENKIKQIREHEIPNLIENLKSQSKEEIKELKNLALDGMDWSLKSMMNHYENIGDFRGFILFCFRYIEFLIENNLDTDNERILVYLRYTKLLIERDEITIDSISDYEEDITLTSLSDYEDEINIIISAILKNSNVEVIELAINIKNNLFKSLNPPSTALEIAKSDELIPSTQQENQYATTRKADDE